MRGVTEDIAILLVGCNADTGGRPMQRTVDAPPSARCADGRSQKSTRRAASSRFIVTRIRGFKKGRRKTVRKGTEIGVLSRLFRIDLRAAWRRHAALPSVAGGQR